jgi:hypothetical protein
MKSSKIICDAITKEYFKESSSSWVILLISAGVGIVCAIITYQKEKAGIYSLGALGGVAMAMIL